MVEIKKILVPTDFSENSINAYTHAQELAQNYGAKIDLIHIVPTLKYFSESIGKLGIPFDMDEEFFPRVLEEADHRLKAAMDDYIGEANRGETIAVTGRKASRSIAEHAEEGGYGLVVMAARGENDSDLLPGGITEKLIRHSDVPVFTVDNRLRAEDINTILVPTDISSLSFTCFPLALMLATTYDAEIELFHVQELYGSGSGSIKRDPRKSEKEDIYAAIIDQLEEYLITEDLENIMVRRGEVIMDDQVVITDGASSESVNLRTVIQKGVSAHYEIENYAPANADLVVMTTHGHSGLAHFLLGSTTEKVVQHLRMPVVTVKPKKSALS